MSKSPALGALLDQHGAAKRDMRERCARDDDAARARLAAALPAVRKAIADLIPDATFAALHLHVGGGMAIADLVAPGAA